LNAVSVTLVVAGAIALGIARAQSPDASDLAEGMRLYQQKGNCRACHGWAGDGRSTDSEMPVGPNLRDSRLGRAALVLTIKCGRLNSQMPAFDKFAYSDGRCYGKTQADLKASPTRMPDPAATLQPREIELIADFMLAKIVGQGPMDHAKCVEFWGSDVEACRDLPK
jgi:Cytochrome C oxidase, cbb3-type, subunit III